MPFLAFSAYISTTCRACCSTLGAAPNIVITEGIITRLQQIAGGGHIFIGKNITPGIIIQQEKTEKAGYERLPMPWQFVDSIYLETIFG